MFERCIHGIMDEHDDAFVKNLLWVHDALFYCQKDVPALFHDPLKWMTKSDSHLGASSPGAACIQYGMKNTIRSMRLPGFSIASELDKVRDMYPGSQARPGGHFLRRAMCNSSGSITQA